MKRKVKSTTLWFSVWAAAMLSYGLFFKIDLSWFSAAAPMLLGIIITYVAGNKAYDWKHGHDTE